jgi:hypothetical protein
VRVACRRLRGETIWRLSSIGGEVPNSLIAQEASAWRVRST